MVKRNAIATKLTKICTQTQKRAFDVAVCYQPIPNITTFSWFLIQDWLPMVPGGFLRFFMVPGWFFIVSGDFFKMFFHGSRLVFCDYRSVFMVFDNSKLVSIVFHCSRLAFHSEFHCFFAALDLFTIP